MSRFRQQGANEAFFNQRSDQSAGAIGGVAAPGGNQALNAVLRGCRCTGVLSLTNRDLSSVPLQIFAEELEEGVKVRACACSCSCY